MSKHPVDISLTVNGERVQGRVDARKTLVDYLRDDLGESNNLAAAEPQRAAHLDKLIDSFLADTRATYPKPNPAYRAGR